jgi:phosphoribosylformylglycinamidine synthase II
MPVFRIEIMPRLNPSDPSNIGSDPLLTSRLRAAGLSGVQRVRRHRLFLIAGGLQPQDVESLVRGWLADPVIETIAIQQLASEIQTPGGWISCEVFPLPGVMDPVAETTLTELQSAGYAVQSVRTGQRYLLQGEDLDEESVHLAVGRSLANESIEAVHLPTAGIAEPPSPRDHNAELQHVPLRELSDEELDRLSRDAHLFLTTAEMRTIQAHYQAAGREPTDLELETLAQTWSEHCVHKTLKSAMVYRGATFPSFSSRASDSDQEDVEIRFDNLLRDTIAKATDDIRAGGKGPQCLSVFVDNAGVIVFDDDYGIAFKVETHNHPSAIEPYGGAATGIGGCIRDIMGCGRGAKPVANTNVFCVAPTDWPLDNLPRGVLHPQRVLRGVVSGVADYGNRMGIPTVNGAVYFDPRYLGNPIVYAGCVGLIPRDLVEKQVNPGDLIVVIGGRTGRDGIHGATFSSAELTDSHADEFSHAVQIGNAITQKRCLDALLRARDAEQGCLFSAVTDCGAGGLSSAVGEMGEEVGADVVLDHVPLKYAGLRYDEIWISEAQERMVLAVPPENEAALMTIMQSEEVEATIIGTFGCQDPATGRPRLVVSYRDRVVGELDMHFLHDGLPRFEREAVWQPASSDEVTHAADEPKGDLVEVLQTELAGPIAASKAWIIRQYDHEVQGGSVVKPLMGTGRGPTDAAVIRPRLDSQRGVVVACGLQPALADQDPYFSAIAAIDEALRNVVSVGGDPQQAAILDNFCWGSSSDPQRLGALVRACQACYDASVALGLPFISGKDSLNNQFALEAGDVAPVIDAVRGMLRRGDSNHGLGLAAWQQFERELTQSQRIRIPDTLLISAISLIEDVHCCMTSDLKVPQSKLWLIGGLDPLSTNPADTLPIHSGVAQLIRDGLVSAVHDISDGGWLVAAAEMAIGGWSGAELNPAATQFAPHALLNAGYLVEVADESKALKVLTAGDISYVMLGRTLREPALQIGDNRIGLDSLRGDWVRWGSGFAAAGTA